MSADTNRQPAGQPTGGQFAPTTGSDSGVDLASDRGHEEFLASLDTDRQREVARALLDHDNDVLCRLDDDDALRAWEDNARSGLSDFLVDQMNATMHEHYVRTGSPKADGDFEIVSNSDGPDSIRASWYQRSAQVTLSGHPVPLTDVVTGGRGFRSVVEIAARADEGYEQLQAKEPKPMTMQDFRALANVVSMQDAESSIVFSRDGGETVREGVFRRGTFDADGNPTRYPDVRQGHARITTSTGAEVFLPMSEVLDMSANGLIVSR